jgi:hypothetical protein
MIGPLPPRAVSSTRTGRPLEGSAHRSTRPTVVSPERGRMRRPSASTPATRRGRIDCTSPAVAAAASRRPSSGGRRSAGRAKRTTGSPSVRSTWRVPELHSSVPEASWYRSRSPTGLSSSTRQSTGLATQARMRVIPPSSVVSRSTAGRSGTPRLALDSA